MLEKDLRPLINLSSAEPAAAESFPTLPSGRGDFLTAGPVRISEGLAVGLTSDFSLRLIVALSRAEYLASAQVVARATDNRIALLRELRPLLDLGRDPFLDNRTYRAVATLRKLAEGQRDEKGKGPYLAAALLEFERFLTGRHSKLLVTNVSLILRSAEDGQGVVVPAIDPPGLQSLIARYQSGLADLRRTHGDGEFPRRIAKRVERGAAALELCKKIFELRGFGMRPESISRRLKIARNIPGKVLEGHPPAHLREMDRPGGRRRGEVMPIPRAPSNDWAFVLGALQGSILRPAASGSIAILNQDQAFLESVAAAVKRIAPNTNPKIVALSAADPESIPKYVMRFGSVAFVRAMSSLTDRCRAMPWTMLGTSEERFAYLRGVAGSAASFGGGGVVFYDANRMRFMVELAQLFNLCGMPPSLGFSKFTTVAFRDAESLRWLLKQNILRPAHARGVEAQLGSRSEKQSNHAAEVYDSVIASCRGRTDIGFKDLRERTGIPEATLRGWVEGRVRPRVIDRREDVGNFVRSFKVPDADAAAFLFRSTSLRARECLELAGLGDFKAVKKASEQMLALSLTVDRYGTLKSMLSHKG